MRASVREERRLYAESVSAGRKNRRQEGLRDEFRKELSCEQTLRQTKARPFDGLPTDLRDTLRKRAPRLEDSVYADKMKNLIVPEHPRLRPLNMWKPDGKSPERVIRSLCAHLFDAYATPRFLWNTFLVDPPSLRLIAVRVGAGESFFKVCKELLPLGLTRAQCHSMLQSAASDDFISVLRRVQIQAEGGTVHLHRAWMQTEWGRTLGDAEDFRFSVLRLLARNPMLDLNQLGPIIDYLRYELARNPDYSMKGRTGASLLAAVERWHGNLRKAYTGASVEFAPSGFAPFRKEEKEVVYEIHEILSSGALHKEGQELRHCVSSYAHSVIRGVTSIWSLRADGERAITIEVRNQTKQIVQARGKVNRRTTAVEDRLIQAWATKVGLTQAYSW